MSLSPMAAATINGDQAPGAMSEFGDAPFSSKSATLSLSLSMMASKSGVACRDGCAVPSGTSRGPEARVRKYDFSSFVSWNPTALHDPSEIAQKSNVNMRFLAVIQLAYSMNVRFPPKADIKAEPARRSPYAAGRGLGVDCSPTKAGAQVGGAE